ncbi:MAG TPA: 30S ribosomal protein S6 [Patescibacteria group bacterium]
MRTYELVLVVKPSLTEANRKKLLDEVKSLLSGKVTKEEDLGSKALSYKIGKELTGHYFDLFFETEKLATDLERKLLENDNVLRHLLLKSKGKIQKSEVKSEKAEDKSEKSQAKGKK